MSLRTELEDVIYRYAYCYDTNDVDGLVDCFCPDAKLFPRPGGPPCQGRNDLAAYFTEARGRRVTLGQQPRHMISGVTVLEQADAGVRTMCNMTLILTWSDGHAEVDHAGQYRDLFVAVGEAWKFAERHTFVDRKVDFGGRLLPPG